MMLPVDGSDMGWRKLDPTMLALIVSLVLQTGGVVWWLSSLNYRVNSNCAAIEESKDSNAVIAVHTSQLASLERNMDRLVTKLDRYITLQLKKGG